MSNNRKNRVLHLLFVAVYMVSYITRINFGVVISEIERDTQWSRTVLSAVVTGSFITYGAGQIISGIIADRFSPKKLVLLGLMVTVTMNLLMPLCSTPYGMMAVWCINGVAQAFMWPPMVRLMVAAFSGEEYKKAAVSVSWASAYGTIAVYFAAPLLITLFNWKAVFLFSALCGMVMMVFWWKYCIDVRPDVRKNIQHEVNNAGNRALFTPVVLGIMLAIALQGMLRDGVTTWMPSYIADTYHLGTSVSILTGVVLPLFTILCTQLVSVLYRKKVKCPIQCSLIMFAIGTVAAVGLYAFTGGIAVLSVVFSALLTGSMHGVCSMLTAMIPPFFKKYGNVSTASGVLNACTYVGSSISTYGIALLSEKQGWRFTILLWIGIAALGAIVCLLVVKPWQRRFMEQDNHV